MWPIKCNCTVVWKSATPVESCQLFYLTQKWVTRWPTRVCMSVGLLCSVIGHTVGFKQGKWPGNVWEETTEGKERHWNQIKATKIGNAFAENQRISDCFVKAIPQALTSQLWSIYRTLSWNTSDPRVSQMKASARWVSRECPPRAGCGPKSSFYRKIFMKRAFRADLNSSLPRPFHRSPLGWTMDWSTPYPIPFNQPQTNQD